MCPGSKVRVECANKALVCSPENRNSRVRPSFCFDAVLQSIPTDTLYIYIYIYTHVCLPPPFVRISTDFYITHHIPDNFAILKVLMIKCTNTVYCTYPEAGAAAEPLRPQRAPRAPQAPPPPGPAQARAQARAPSPGRNRGQAHCWGGLRGTPPPREQRLRFACQCSLPPALKQRNKYSTRDYIYQ